MGNLSIAEAHLSLLIGCRGYAQEHPAVLSAAPHPIGRGCPAVWRKRPAETGRDAADAESCIAIRCRGPKKKPVAVSMAASCVQIRRGTKRKGNTKKGGWERKGPFLISGRESRLPLPRSARPNFRIRAQRKWGLKIFKSQ